MNQKLVTRILALLLALSLLLGLVPLVFADEGNLGSGTPDGTPPQLLSIELSATSGAAPGSVAFTAEATDDVSGVWDIGIYFQNEYGDSVGGWAHSTYKDPATGEQVPYADGKFHGEVKMGQYVSSGTYNLSAIYVCDYADNRTVYTDKDIQYPDSNTTYVPVPDWFTQREFTVTYSATPDHTPPELIDVTLTVTEITAPGTIDVIVDATDDVSGVFECKLFFDLQGGDPGSQWLSATVVPTYYDSDLKQHIPYPDGKLHGEIPISDHVDPGTYVLTSAYLGDVAGNDRHYDMHEYSDNPPIPESVTMREFTVINDYVWDTTPPELTELTFATNTITAPGVIDFTATIDGNCEGMVDIYLWCEETQKELECWAESSYRDPETGEWIPYPDGKLHGKLEVGQYLVAGTFIINSIDIHDDDGNWIFYVEDPSSYANEEARPFPEWLNREIRVLNAVADVTTSVVKPEFVDQLANANDDAYIVADFSGEATLPETAFDAISGTDKTLDLVSEGVTWRFNGNDIVNDSKPIDLNVNITKLEESPSAEIQEKLDDTPAVVMKFAENGVLPGKATIQVKVDYAMREYLGASRELCVYYFNNQTGKLELIAENLMVINDTYIEFPITHCSYYILSTKIEEPAEPEHEFQYGDVNHDGRVNVTDAVMVMKHRANALTEEDVFCERCANVDTNPKINVSDAVLIMKKRANKDMIFPIETQ